MELESLRKEATNLFENYFLKFVIGDLKILDSIQPETHGNSCAVPTAMLILSSLEYIGYLLDPTGKVGESEDNISCSINSSFYPEKYSKDDIKDIIVVYRHGMMHMFFPQQIKNTSYGIHKAKGKDLFEVLKHEGNNVKSLNVNVFSNDFKRLVDNLYNEMKKTKDVTFIKNMLKGHNKIEPSSGKSSSAVCLTQTTFPYGNLSNKK